MQHTPGRRHPNPAFPIACCILALILAGSSALLAEQWAYQVNDRVETNISNFGWQKGSIKAIGTGANEGKLRILTDGNAQDNWVNLKLSHKYIRKLAGAGPATAPADANQPPRLGKYLIVSQGPPSNPPLHLGYLELLAGGSYKSLDMGGNATGDGRYDYDWQTSVVRWISGPFLTNKWGGKFEISRAGKTHSIRFTRTTLGTSSTD
jgi:hypothetical protein